MAINFSGYSFSEPIRLDWWAAPSLSGVYAILVPDSTFSPRPFRVIYFGEAGDLSIRGIGQSHHRYQCWLRQANLNSNNLYIAVYLTTNWYEYQRRELESKLISNYNPICNQTT